MAKLVLPTPAKKAAAVPAAASTGVDGTVPFVTEAKDFYRIDTVLSPPVIDPEQWSLRIHGMVENELTLTMDDVLDLPLEEHHITLTCVSNPVGGELVGNATWLGYPVRELLARAQPSTDADMVLSHSFDGFTASTPIGALTDDRAASCGGNERRTAHTDPRVPRPPRRPRTLRIRLRDEMGDRTRGHPLR